MTPAGVLDWTWTVLGGLLAVLGGWPLTLLVFRLADGPGTPGPPEPDAVTTDGAIEEAADRLAGGLWIGFLERLACYVGLCLGSMEAVALVIAIKSFGRYPELRAGSRPGVAERFIIGTLTSLLWAAACTGVVRILVG